MDQHEHHHGCHGHEHQHDDRDELERLHRLEVKSAFSNYSRDLREENSALYVNVTNNEFYKQNQ